MLASNKKRWRLTGKSTLMPASRVLMTSERWPVPNKASVSAFRERRKTLLSRTLRAETCVCSTSPSLAERGALKQSNALTRRHDGIILGCDVRPMLLTHTPLLIIIKPHSLPPLRHYRWSRAYIPGDLYQACSGLVR